MSRYNLTDVERRVIEPLLPDRLGTNTSRQSAEPDIVAATPTPTNAPANAGPPHALAAPSVNTFSCAANARANAGRASPRAT